MAPLQCRRFPIRRASSRSRRRAPSEVGASASAVLDAKRPDVDGGVPGSRVRPRRARCWGANLRRHRLRKNGCRRSCGSGFTVRTREDTRGVSGLTPSRRWGVQRCTWRSFGGLASDLNLCLDRMRSILLLCLAVAFGVRDTHAQQPVGFVHTHPCAWQVDATSGVHHRRGRVLPFPRQHQDRQRAAPALRILKPPPLP
jgi:hypothetical protein